ncbi:MAG: LysE family transporter [Bacteroidota bacterium]
MILGYSFIGLFLASLGGAAPGASNLAVIKTTTTDSFQKGMHIALGAGLGEILLAFMALCYSSLITQFFQMNLWIQVSFIVLFSIIGVLFYFSEQLAFISKPRFRNGFYTSKFVTGFILSVLNPPVLLFWILAISLTQKYILPIDDMSSLWVLVLFFTGVFLGKIGVLYVYAKLGNQWKGKEDTNKSKLNKLIGVVLVILATFQGVRFLIQ